MATGLAFLCLTARLIALSQLGVARGGFELLPALHMSALTDHFWEFILFAHTKPPLTDVIYSILFRVCDSCNNNNLSLIPVMLFDTAAAVLVYLACLRIGTDRVLSFLITAVWSVGLVSFEVWKFGLHQDHYTVFLASLFAWALVNRTTIPRLRNDLILAAAASILVLQSTVALVAVPLTLLATLWISSGSITRLPNYKPFLVVALLPVLIGGGLVVKNYINVGVPSSSSVGGQNMMQFVLVKEVGTWNHDGLYERAQHLGLPEWWLWCFQRSREIYPNPRVQAPLYGRCITSPTRYDFVPLQVHLASGAETDLSKLIAQDQQDSERRPWLFAGAVSESTTRFAAKYGSQSFLVWMDYLTHQPLDFLISSIEVHHRFYMAGHTMLSGYPNMPELLRVIFKWVLRLAALGTYLLAAGLVSYPLYSKKRNVSSSLIAVGLIAFASVVTASLFNISTCCENDRMYLQVTPYLVIVASYGVFRLWSVGSNVVGVRLRIVELGASNSSQIENENCSY